MEETPPRDDTEGSMLLQYAGTGIAGSDASAPGRSVAPREWTRTIDRTGNNRLLYH